MSGKRYSVSIKQFAIEAYLSGSTLIEVAEMVGATQASVTNWLHKSGFETRGAHYYSDRRGAGPAVWDRVEELYRQGIGSPTIAKEVGLTTGAVVQIVRRKGLSRTKAEANRLAGERVSVGRRVHKVNEDFFYQKMTASMAWVLGVICGDGSVIWDRKRKRYTDLEISGDEDVCKKVRDALQSEHPIKKRGGCSLLRMSSKKLCESLVSVHGITEKKSNVVKKPDGVIEEFESHFVRGLLDSDGSVFPSMRLNDDGKSRSFKVSFGSTSRDLIDLVADRMFKVSGFKSVVIYKPPKKETYSDAWEVGLYSLNAIAFAEWVWSDSDETMRGNRKYDIFRQEVERCKV